MPKPRLYADKFMTRLPEGVLARARAALTQGETVADLVRKALERELAFRQANPTAALPERWEPGMRVRYVQKQD